MAQGRYVLEMNLLYLSSALLVLALVASPSATVTSGLFDLSVTLNSDKPASWFTSRQIDFTIVITNRGTDDKALNITYSLTRTSDSSVIQSSSGSALVRAHQSYTYPLQVTTSENGELKLSVQATGFAQPATVVCVAQPNTPISLGFLSVPLGIASLPLSLLGFGVAVHGLRTEEDLWTICGALFAIVGVLMLIVFGQVWISWITQSLATLKLASAETY